MTAKILVSWVAHNNDFKDGDVDKLNSPNYNFHQHFFNGYECHYILYARPEDDTRAEKLVNTLIIDFPEHRIEKILMNINDVIDLTEIKQKVENFILKYSDHQIDFFFSPGTSIMQLSWYICHTTLALQTRLLQVRPGKFTQSKKPELTEIVVDRSETPITAVIKEQNLTNRNQFRYLEDDFKLTKSIEGVYLNAEKIAQTDSVTTLIRGESGTGKEHLARFIHKNSIRKDNQFIPVNCSAIGNDLLESRLFGYKKGAFTNALNDTPGYFQKANGGTLFLDEIGDISPYMQQTLLRVLQEKEITPVGETKPIKIDVRIISATNKNLEQLCKDEKFRWDLYYRLIVTELELPNLLQRGEKEIEELLNYFIIRKKETLRKPNLLILSKAAKEVFLNYSYPGNIRELENFVETLYVLHYDKEIQPDDLPVRLFNQPEESSLKWQDVEKAHILKVLKLYKGNQRQAWKALGYGSLNTFKSRLREYGIDRLID
jgi:DNA-binding NtrC family response regulator